MKKVAIIGAGASGIFCSILCAKNSLHVDLFEQNTKCAKKILVSGNGRCNIINTSFTQNDLFSQNPSFVKESLNNFPFKSFSSFTSSIGLELDIKSDGKVYPLSYEAKSVALLLEHHARTLGVNILTDKHIDTLDTLLNDYDAVVIATGSQAASHLGGNKDGQEFATSLGHTLIPTYPSLVQLELDGKIYEKMSGSKVDGEVTLLINSKAVNTKQGDILFTAYGVSGFSILDISQEASEALLGYQAVDISLNLLPRYNAQKLSAHILKMGQPSSDLSLLDVLHGLLPLKIAKTVLEVLQFSDSIKAKEIHTKNAKKIANQILNWRFEVKDTHGFRHGEVSGGGVNTDEVNPKTMLSFKHDKVYFTGEVLDVVGRRGGFNFSWCWASAYACAQDIISRTRD